ncbi:uncharacterized mitochondrial protein-like protein [Tanacetum coccineum]
MSASTSQPPAEKETNLTFQCPLLTSTNYTLWRIRMEVLLGIHGVWDVADPGLADAKKNNTEMWEAIKTRNLGTNRVKEARLQTLVTEFENMKMLNNGSIDAYAAKLSGTASKLATLGEVMSEHKLVKKFLTSLPRWTDNSSKNNDSSGGRGCGSYSRGCGRGQGCCRGNNQNQGQHDSSKNREDNKHKGKKEEQHDLSHIECYHCDKYKHFVLRCPDRNRNHEVNLNESDSVV